MPARVTPLTGSSNIAGAGYDKDTRELAVRFHSGRTYTYLEVPEEVYEAFLAADSYGKYFNEHIKDQFVVR